MKKWLAASVAGLMILFSIGVFACDGPMRDGPMREGHNRLGMMKEQLQLTDAQEEQIRKIFEKYRNDDDRPEPGHFMQDMQALDPAADNYQQQLEQLAGKQAEQMKARMVKQGQMRAEIYTVLTPEQQKKMQELHSQMRERMEDRKAKWSKQ